MLKSVMKTIKDNIPLLENRDLDYIPLPTDNPIRKIIFRLSGVPACANVGAPGTLQNAFYPAIAALLGQVTLVGKPLDGSEGVNIKQVPMGLLWFRSWLLNNIQPRVVELDPANPAQACSIEIPIEFADPRLPEAEQLLFCLDAARYGGEQSSLSIQLKTGSLNAANGAASDRVAIVGGTYTTLTPGTLTLSVSVEQLVPMQGGRIPTYKENGALGFFDLDLEIKTLTGITQSASNDVPLNARGVQAMTAFFSCDRDANQIETPVNNLGVVPVPQLKEKLGTQAYDEVNPETLRGDSARRFFSAIAAFPDGVYVKDDWEANLQKAYHLYKSGAAHTWDLNKAASTGTDSLLRILHVTYNPSQVAKKSIGL